MSNRINAALSSLRLIWTAVGENLNSFLPNAERPLPIMDSSAFGDHRWQPIKNKIEEFIGPKNFVSWFNSVTLRSISNTEIVIETAGAERVLLILKEGDEVSIVPAIAGGA